MSLIKVLFDRYSARAVILYLLVQVNKSGQRTNWRIIPHNILAFADFIDSAMQTRFLRVAIENRGRDKSEVLFARAR